MSTQYSHQNLQYSIQYDSSCSMQKHNGLPDSINKKLLFHCVWQLDALLYTRSYIYTSDGVVFMPEST